MDKVFSFIFVVIIGCGFYWFFFTPSSDSKKGSCESTNMAFVMSQKFVKRGLVDPSSASFPYSSDTTSLGDCKFSVKGKVTATNGFGGRIENNYSIIMEYIPKENMWRGTNLSIY